MGLLALSWAIKPVFGLLSDLLPLRGSHHYHPAVGYELRLPNHDKERPSGLPPATKPHVLSLC
ncbi:MAG: hypothetical protein ACREYE_28955 [Gammaproteobacteria bacterium]